MKIWRGYIHQVPSGKLALGTLAKNSEAMNLVFENLLGQQSDSRGKIWKASLFDSSDTWLFAAIGKEAARADEDGWSPREGWKFAAEHSKHAIRLLVHRPSKTFFMEKNPKVSSSGTAICVQLQNLLNLTLDAIDPHADWVFRVRLESDHRDFAETFDRFEQLFHFEVGMSLPNARLDDPLRDLLGHAKDAGAEDVVFELDSKRGIDRSSHFVVRARELLDGFVAWIKARGRMPDGEITTIDTRDDSVPVEHFLNTEDVPLDLSGADDILLELGPLDTAGDFNGDDEVGDDDVILAPVDA